jgi:hypothetical protein
MSRGEQFCDYVALRVQASAFSLIRDVFNPRQDPNSLWKAERRPDPQQRRAGFMRRGRIKCYAAAQTGIVSGGELWPTQRELSRHLKYIARTLAHARISEFESHHPSHAVGLSSSHNVQERRSADTCAACCNAWRRNAGVPLASNMAAIRRMPRITPAPAGVVAPVADADCNRNDQPLEKQELLRCWTNRG